jgi:cell division transport system permease protein
MWRAFFFLLGEAFRNLRRHRLMTAAAMTTIAVTLTLIGCALLTGYQVRTAMNRAAGEFEMHVYCRQRVEKERIGEIEKRLRALPGVASVQYLPKEQAFLEYTRDLPIDTSGIPNQFNETFVLKLADPKDADAIAARIRGWRADVEQVSVPAAEMDGLVRIIGFLRTVGLIGGGALLFGALVVVSNTIRLSVFHRRREIRIMQIVGATPGFIRLPLFFEGLIHGIAGGLLAAGVLYLIERSVQGLIAEVIPMLARYFERLDMIQFGAAVLAVGALIGASGSLLSIRRYLKVV